MHKKIKLLTSVFAAGAMLLTLPMPKISAAASGGAVTISTAEEFLEFAENCALDNWSRGKTVTLTADIDFRGKDFVPVPIFCGNFDGGNHTVSGIKIDSEGSHTGMFRYIAAGGIVHDLNVNGSISPSGSGNSAGGIVGVNSGTLQKCTFSGTVSGNSNIGGIAGENTVSGRIIECSAAGTLNGKTCTGGIVGDNHGQLLKCTNTAGINLSANETSESLTEIGEAELEQLTGSDSGEENDRLTDSSTDTGGIAGHSDGVIQSCTNSGPVGYPHVGYNVGGIAGRQSGYLSDCTNTGTIKGRKEVGGIVGQAEPNITYTPGEGSFSAVRAELDTLNALINAALNSTENTGDKVFARLDSMKVLTDNAIGCTENMADQLTDFADGNIEAVNDLTSDITEALNRMVPAMDSFSGVGADLEQLSNWLQTAADSLKTAADSTDNAVSDLENAVDKLIKCSNDFQTASQNMKKALETIENSVLSDDMDALDEALKQLQEAAIAMSDVFADISDIVDGFSGTDNDNSNTGEEGGDDNGENNGDNNNDLGFDFDTSFDWNEIVSKEDSEKLSADAARLSFALRLMSDSLRVISNNMPALRSSFNTSKNFLKTAFDNLSNASSQLTNALWDIESAMDDAKAVSDAAGAALDALSSAASYGSSIGREVQSAFDDISDAADLLANSEERPFKPLGSEFGDNSDQLFDTAKALSDEAGKLGDELEDGGSEMINYLRDINDQVRAVYNAVLDAFDDIQDNISNAVTDGIVEDTSEEDIAAAKDGKVGSCRNEGYVEGDRNIGGIAGAVAIEIDADPEDDLSDRFRFGSVYETKAILYKCVNYGAIEAKKECAGGAAGRMDLGTAMHCENYGSVTGGDGSSYIGGIAGLTDAAVRNCYSKCALSGGNYIGGIAGRAGNLSDCCAIVNIEEGTEYLGAIAGGTKEKSVLSGNRFVDTGFAAVDGISYVNRAEPVEFKTLLKTEGVPSEFTSFSITFVANGKTVEQTMFDYGDDLSLIPLPQVPALSGEYGEWPEFDTSGLKSDIVVEAIYSPWITLTGSSENGGEGEEKLALALAEGQFTEEAVLHAEESGETPPVSGDNVRVLKVTLEGTELTGDDITPIRLLNSEGNARVYQYEGESGVWRKVDSRVNGKYIVVEMKGTEGIFAVEKVGIEGWVIAVIAGGAAVIVVLIVMIVMIKSRKKKKAKIN